MAVPISKGIIATSFIILEKREKKRMAKVKRFVATVVVLVTAAVLVQGCIVERIMESQEKESYARYRSEAERISLEREKAGLPPQQIMRYDEWTQGKR